ncbi:hypothetical protein BBP40_010124 [Aspergillus hancockii]|nr:hypothetical protein BBP40_010124 [Aspergillus hancockii]
MGAFQWFNDSAPTFEVSIIFLVRSTQGDKLHQTIFLRWLHDITDGVGILQLVDKLFKHAASAYEQGAQYALPKWGKEHKRLSPCLRIAAKIPEPLPEAQTKRYEEIQIQNGAVYQHPGFLNLPSSSACVICTRSRTQCVSCWVPKASTEQILRKCKAFAPGISVTNVFMAALALALSELQPRKKDPDPVRYVNHSMINLRPYCHHPYDSPEYAATPYHTISAQALGIDLVVPGSSDETKNTHVGNELSRIATEV